MARICMIVFSEYRSDARVRREAEALVERGDVVDCICTGKERSGYLAGVRLLCISSGRYRGANLVRVFLAYLRFFCQAFFKVSLLHLRKPYDIVQAHTMPDFLVFAGIVPKLLGAKVILDVHDLMPEVYAVKFGSPRTRWMRRLITWVERLSVAFADKAICVHEPHLQALVEHGNARSKFSVLLNVPDHRIFVPQKRAAGWHDSFRLIYHGTTPTRAGLDVALRAVARVRKEIPHIQFHVVGVKEGRERLADLIQRFGLTDCVRLDPSIPVEQLPAVMAQADVGVVPYLADVFTQYVLPTKLLEYAAVGLPAIVSRLRTVETYFDSNMLAFFEAGNDVELADEIMRLYRNPDLAAQLASNAARFIETYNWPQQREIYFRLVDSLLPARRILVSAN